VQLITPWGIDWVGGTIARRSQTRTGEAETTKDQHTQALPRALHALRH
jgi:hypothetical protein